MPDHDQKTNLSDFDRIPDSAFIRQQQLVGTVIPFSASTLWRKVRQGEFPAPVRISAGVTAFRAGDVRQWLRDPVRFRADGLGGHTGTEP
jgi:prophage regulatory protein